MKAPHNRREQIIKKVEEYKAEFIADLLPDDAEKLQSYSGVFRGDKYLVIDKDGAEVDPATLEPECVLNFWWRIVGVVPVLLGLPDDLPPDYQATRGMLTYLHDDKEKAVLRGDTEWQKYRVTQIEAVLHQQDQLVSKPMRQAAAIKNTKRKNLLPQALKLQAERARLIKENEALPKQERRLLKQIDAKLLEDCEISRATLHRWLKLKPGK